MRTTSDKIQIGVAAMMTAGFLLMMQPGRAQNHMQLSYNYSISMGDTRDFIDRGSFRGGTFQLGHHLTGRIALGLKLGLHTFYQDLEKDTYTEDNITVYGKQFRYLNSSPALLTGQYNLTDRSNRIIPYVKLGLGACYIQQRTDIGFYTFTNDYQWNFGFQPEAGVLVPLGQKIGISAGAEYLYSLGNRSIGNQQYLSVHLGLILINLGQQQQQR